ncbi:MAG: hypothetical protein IPK88_02695 [Saprospiraceae bacterium]|nr:hypothetical protein [Candidatus Defluviibacterium haderslevense]MCC7027696.1 hypothetical protein [Saprospiraceae bacterium]MCI1268108.1 hypothetical protein [Saprospiraceae bacterium]
MIDVYIIYSKDWLGYLSIVSEKQIHSYEVNEFGLMNNNVSTEPKAKVVRL